MAYTTINKPVSYFDVTLYSGNDGTQSITSLNFKPDFLWIKSRNTAVNHQLIDVIRGNTKQISSSDSAAEATPTYPYTSTFDTNGWTMTNGSLSGGNTTGRTYVGWSWLGGGTGVSNTSGSITSTVSANTTSGFSVVTYAGSSSNITVGHGLGIAPKMILVKDRTVGFNWQVYHASLGADKYIEGLNTTAAASTGTLIWQNTTPTSSIFYLGGNVDGSNKSGSNQVAYCFAEIKGFSKFGSYTGNGSTDGPFIYTGMLPAFLMLKRTDTTGSWQMYDNKRDTYNPEISRLAANLSSEESTSASIYIDFLSNGFKMRNSTADWNASGGTYIYMAFAENPFVSSKGIPTTARWFGLS